jgi:acetyl-CoA carboxylase biotin carboxylase subunit
VLVANRGEIAVRVIRACRDEGISPVAVYSDPDRAARHVRLADRAVRLGPAPSAESYLRSDRVLDAARATEADAVHPGYGFLSENADFAREVEAAGLVWIGPPPAAIEVMGDKGTARAAAVRAGVPVVPGTEPIGDGEAVAAAERIGYPVLIKAVAGGGGKGMRRVEAPDELLTALQLARSEARNAFGNDQVYVEKFLRRPRHVELQVLGGPDGRALHLGERDCSTQRRHQKLIEESPSPVVAEELRRRMGAVACAVSEAVGYRGAGTVEFLVDPEDRDADGLPRFYFLEMNTRLQVEHPVTELVTGLDLVRLQLAVARGEALPIAQEDVRLTGHALECRIYAEDPTAGFAPSPGRLSAFLPPDGPGVRCDSGVEAGDEISIHYDPMIAKLLTWGRDRAEAIARMSRALREFTISGVKTSVPFHLHLLEEPAFVAGQVHVNHVDTEFVGAEDLRSELPDEELALSAVTVALDDLIRARRRAVRPAPKLAPWAEGGRLSIRGRR